MTLCSVSVVKKRPSAYFKPPVRVGAVFEIIISYDYCVVVLARLGVLGTWFPILFFFFFWHIKKVLESPLTCPDPEVFDTGTTQGSNPNRQIILSLAVHLGRVPIRCCPQGR